MDYSVRLQCTCGAIIDKTYKTLGALKKRQKNVFLCPECRKKSISEKLRNLWDNQEYRNRVTNNSTKTWHNKELRIKAAANKRSIYYNVELTAEMLGDVGPLRFNPKVIKTCAQCGKNDIVRYRSKRQPDTYHCRKCVRNKPEVRIKVSLATKKQWENEEYRKSMTKHLHKIRSDIPKASKIQVALYNILDDLNVKY
jgi:predicted RNA-binding Zn-ribbon protein involved in translation (DUF1610 family)